MECHGDGKHSQMEIEAVLGEMVVDYTLAAVAVVGVVDEV
jgi:hypothetical protein